MVGIPADKPDIAFFGEEVKCIFELFEVVILYRSPVLYTVHGCHDV